MTSHVAYLRFSLLELDNETERGKREIKFLNIMNYIVDNDILTLLDNKNLTKTILDKLLEAIGKNSSIRDQLIKILYQLFARVSTSNPNCSMIRYRKSEDWVHDRTINFDNSSCYFFPKSSKKFIEIQYEFYDPHGEMKTVIV